MGSMKINMEVRFIISLLFSALVAAFAIQNADSVSIRFLLYEFNISQAIVILGSAILGAIIVVFLGLIKQIRQGMKIKQLTKEITKLTEEKNMLQMKLEETTVAVKEEKVEEVEAKEEMSVIELEK